jgi:hypothetical protein
MLEGGKIYEAISNVMSEIGAIGKEKKNLQQGFMYRGIDDVMNALQPALVKHKVFIAPEVISEQREERTTQKGGAMFSVRLEIAFRFYTIDGSFISTKVIGEAMDSGDKATNKAMSIGYKYACFQVFCIPTEEMMDPDSESHEPAPKNGRQPAKQTESKQQKSPAANPLANNRQEVAQTHTPGDQQMNEVAKHVIDETKLSVLRKKAAHAGVAEKSLCGRYAIEKLEDCTEEMFIKAMKALEKTLEEKNKQKS